MTRPKSAPPRPGRAARFASSGILPICAGEDRPQITLCGRNSVQIHEHHRPVDFAEMQRRLEPHGKVNFNRLLLRFERGKYTVTLFADGRALVQGTTDVTRRSQSLCALYWQLKQFRNWCRPKPPAFTWFSLKENHSSLLLPDHSNCENALATGYVAGRAQFPAEQPDFGRQATSAPHSASHCRFPF